MSFDPANYAVGDIVKISQTFKVVAADGLGIDVEDVKSGEDVYLYPGDDTMRVEMVKRAARPKPKAGAILTGAEIGKIQWKRGTIIQCVRVSGSSRPAKGIDALVLFADGKWHDCAALSSYEFDDLQRDAGFELLLVA